MSAAEKLKVLEPVHMTIKAGAENPYAVGAITLYNVPLPQIVAVVEAAETCAPILHNALGTAGMNMTPGHLLDDALAALESALS